MHPSGVKEREEQQAAAGRRPGWWRWAAGAILAGALLMLAYLRVAGTTEVNADAAGLVLQASDMLHGNLLLHGWWDTDVSFVTTELPQYMAVTKLAGLRPEVVHICAALTYTLLVLLAAFVARGRAHGPEGVVRALLAAGIMLAPQPTGNTTVLLGSPDHTGTALPVLLLLLLLDRVPDPRAPARRYVLAGGAVCLATVALLGAAMVGDPLVEVIGVVPLVLACAAQVVRISAVRGVRAWRGRNRVMRNGAGVPPARSSAASPAGEAGRAAGGRAAAGTSWRAVCYHLLLALAALAAIPLARWLNALITAHAGYQLGPNRYHQLPWDAISKDAPLVWQSFLAVFGADYTGVTGAGNVAFALCHLAGVALVIGAAVFAVWRLLVPSRRARAGDLIAGSLVLAVLVNVAAYLAFVVPSNIYAAHEIGPVAALGAALAGRVLGPPLLRVRVRRRAPGTPAPADRSRRGFPVLVPVLALFLACYAALLGIAATYPQGPPQNVSLAAWLVRHHLRSGLASYWEASPVTVETGGQVSMLAIGIHGYNRRLAPDQWETDVRLGNPATHSANFVVAGPDRIVPVKLAVGQFGQPARTYRDGPYTIMVWNRNLLGQLNPV